MIRFTSFLLLLTLVFHVSCSHNQAEMNGDWHPGSQESWPSFLLTSEIVFTDQTFTDFASGFLLRYREDTFAITSKQLFMAFSGMGIFTIDFQDKLQSWTMYPPGDREQRIVLGALLNPDSTELSALPHSTSTTDWLIFEVEENSSDVRILELAGKGLEKGDQVWSGFVDRNQPSSPEGVVRYSAFVLQLFDNQIFFQSDQTVTNPGWITGSPLLNRNGEVTGVLTALNQQLGQSCSAAYFYDVLTSRYPEK